MNNNITIAFNQLDPKKDFYLYFLLSHQGQSFKPETLLGQREFYLKHQRLCPFTELDALIPRKGKIECCDTQTLSEVRKRMSYLIDLIAECMQCGNNVKQAEAESELKQLTYYVKKSTVRGGKIYHFQTIYNRMKASVLKSIHRSITTLANTHPDLALHIRQHLIVRPEIGISTFL
ncbi:MAG TPA: hypothetical protein PK816_07165 [Candidatus Cloacimonadota bacterium]|jgi:hypothetical protein|nr:hypothetical protein [Candidatus Cloacimonadota bacterium]